VLDQNGRSPRRQEREVVVRSIKPSDAEGSLQDGYV